MFNKLLLRLAGPIALLLAMTGSACSTSGKSDKLTVAVTTPSWNSGFAVFQLAQAQGYFEAEGLDVEFTLPPSGTQAAQQVLSGNADVALVTPEPVVIGAAKGEDLKYIANYYGNWIYGLATLDAGQAGSVESLRGKRIGVTNIASSGTTFARTALKSAGVDPDKEVTFVPIGVGAQQVNAIKSGQVDALALWDTQYQIVRNAGIDVHEIAVPEAEGLFGGGFAVRGKNLDKDGDKYARFGRAFGKGVVLAQSDPRRAIEAMWSEQPDTAPGADRPREQALEQEAEVLQVRLKGVGVPPGRKEWGTIDPQHVQRMVDFSRTAGLVDKPVDPASIVDTRFLQQMNDFSAETVIQEAKPQ